MKRLLIYSHDTYGLGNIRRMLSIAYYLVERHSDLSILIISGSPMLQAFRASPQIDYIKLPCLERTAEGEYHARLDCVDMGEIVKLRSNIILNVVLGYRPDLVLVDKKPEGLCEEMRPALQIIRQQRNAPKCVLLLRDILDAPEITREVWKKHDYLSAIDEFYDEVIVVGQKSIFDVVKEYGFSKSVADKTIFCGYLERSAGRLGQDEIRQQLGLTEQPLVLVAAGGGNDGRHVFLHYLKGLQQQPLDNKGKSLLFYGPEMCRSDIDALQQQALLCQEVELREFSSDFVSYLRAANVVIGMGGYNTVCEILSHKKHAIIIPRVSPVKEQLIRAERFSQRGLIDYLHPDDLNGIRLMALVKQRLESAPITTRNNEIELDGMQRVEQRLLFHFSSGNEECHGFDEMPACLN